MVKPYRSIVAWVRRRPYIAVYILAFVASTVAAASAAGSLDDVIGAPGCAIVNGIGTKTAAAMTGVSLIAVMVGAFGFGEEGREFIKKFAWAIIPGFVLLNVATILKILFSSGC